MAKRLGPNDTKGFEQAAVEIAEGERREGDRARMADSVRSGYQTEGDDSTAVQTANALLARAVAHLARGEDDAALQAASEACHAAPHLPQSHYAYGQAWAALGEQANAERAFAEALRLAPDWAEAWVNYGVARYRQGAMD